jgi:hypothetical protein
MAAALCQLIPTTNLLPLLMLHSTTSLLLIFFNAAENFAPVSVALLKGRDFLKVKLWSGKEDYPKHNAALHSYTKATVLGHLKTLRDLQERIQENPQLQDVPLVEAILHHLDLASTEGRRRWLPTSHFREMTKMDGAFSNLGKYAMEMDHGIKLSDSTTWKNALKTWKNVSMEDQPVNQRAVKVEEISKAVSLTQDKEVRSFIMLLWLLCARKGDVAHLRPHSVRVKDNGRLEAFIQEGKGVKAREGKYHVISHCPPEWKEELTSFLDSKLQEKYLFRRSLAFSQEVLLSLRLADPTLSCRSVRRGAAQALAASGTPEEVIMKMTGHKCLTTLHRYLNWDQINESAHSKAQAAAKKALNPSKSH